MKDAFVPFQSSVLRFDWWRLRHRARIPIMPRPALSLVDDGFGKEFAKPLPARLDAVVIAFLTRGRESGKVIVGGRAVFSDLNGSAKASGLRRNLGKGISAQLGRIEPSGGFPVMVKPRPSAIAMMPSIPVMNLARISRKRWLIVLALTVTFPSSMIPSHCSGARMFQSSRMW